MVATAQSDATVLTSSIATHGTEEERRFVWFFQSEEAQKLRAEQLRSSQSTTPFEYIGHEALPASSRLDKKKDFADKFRAGAGAKGKTGSTDFTRGKNAFVRPCTVGWKSQNQPLQRGGGNRTPL
jgi:hypothetical protein